MDIESDFLDDAFVEHEQFPREFVAEFKVGVNKKGQSCVEIFVNGVKFGDTIRDNHYEDDCYRCHDVFHFSYERYWGGLLLLAG